MDYSLRIYKNEYAELHLNFICKAFKVNLETEKVIEIVGEQEQLEKVMSGMFCTDEQFKALFPEYQTRKERDEWTSKELETLKKTIATTLCRVINQGEPSGEQFTKFRDFYLNQLCK